MKKLIVCTGVSVLWLLAASLILDVSAHPAAPPTLIAIAPITGPADQQTPITITGRGFISPATALLGDTPLLDVTYVDSTTLLGRVPFGLETGVHTLTVAATETVTLGEAFTVTAGTLGWASGGPYGGQTGAIAIHPTATDTVYVAASLAGLFRTVDGGERWELVLHQTRGAAPEIAVWPPDTDVVFYAAADGLYRSDSKGDPGTWQRVPVSADDDENFWPNDFAIARSDPNTLYCTTGDALFYSTDGGSTWERRPTGLQGHLRHLAVDPDVAETVYASHTQRPELYKTTDAGQSWEQLPFTITYGLDRMMPVESIATDPYRETTLWVGGSNNGFYRSLDGGQTFTNVTSLITVSQQSWFPTITFDPNMDRVYVGSIGPNSAIHYSDDAGATWHALGLNNRGGMDIAVPPGDSDTIYTTWAGVRKSTDQGQTWGYAAEGLAAIQPWLLAVSPHDPDRVIATANLEGAFSTHTRGNTWLKIRAYPEWEAEPHRAATFDPVSPTIAYLGGSEGVYKTTDDGTSWVTTGPLPLPDPPGTYKKAQVQYLIHHPVTPSLLYAGAALEDATAPNDPDNIGSGALYISDDGAQSWTLISATGTLSNVNRVVFAPSDSRMIYLGTGMGDAGVMGNGIWRSIDGGETWSHPEPPEMAGMMVQGLTIHPHDPQLLLAGIWDGPNSGRGVCRSVDGGDTWQPTAGLDGDGERKVTAIAYHGDNLRIVYAATHGGLRVSFDGGQTWRSYPGAVGQIPITTMTVVPSETGTILYLGTVGGTIVTDEPGRLTAGSPTLLGAGVYVGKSQWYAVNLPLVLR